MELVVRVRRSAEGLVEVVGSVEQIWRQLERELARQDQASSAAAAAIDGAVAACDRLTGESAEAAVRVGRLVAALRPLFDDLRVVRTAAVSTAASAGASEELHRALAQECRSVLDTCARVSEVARAVEAAVLGVADGGDRVRVAVGDVGQSVHRIEEGVSLLAQGFRVLEEIADRSALLAVNAAIVAARSASAGGGFTIVADEMRDLAQRAADGVHEALQVAGGLGRDVRGAVLAVEVVLARLDQAALGARGVRTSVESLLSAASSAQDDACRVETVANQAGREVLHTRQQAEQILSAGQRMGMPHVGIEAQLEGGGALESSLRELTDDLGSSVRGSVAQARESVQALRRPADVVERLDALARALGQSVQLLESDLRLLADVSLRAQDLARLLVDDVGSALRDPAEAS
ncbi:MAG: hypothetical protein IPK07_09895 [Deltaproteobacteria bacterium]|nr:hypothetical protein [Deltaproteobacteria bacterium]